MKVFQVVWGSGSWRVHIPDSSAGVYPSKDRSEMVAWACDAARRVAGEVHVRDRGGQIETVYFYGEPDMQPSY